MDLGQGQVFWAEEPRWDSIQLRYYFEGYQMSIDGSTRGVTRYLRPDEIGSDGQPLPGLDPNWVPGGLKGQPSTRIPNAGGGQDFVYDQSSGGQFSYEDQFPYGDQSGAHDLASSSLEPPSDFSHRLQSSTSNYILGTGDQTAPDNFSENNTMYNQARAGQLNHQAQYGSQAYRPADTHFSEQPELNIASNPGGIHQSLELGVGESQWLSAAPPANSFAPPFQMQGTGSTQPAQPPGTFGVRFASPGGQFPHAAFSGLPGSSSGAGRSAGQVHLSSTGILEGGPYKPERIEKSKSGKEFLKSKSGKEFMKSKTGKEFLKSQSGKEYMDLEKFKLHTSQSFRPGRIFKILWSEPKGVRQGKPTKISNPILLEEAKTRFWTGFRRFIIIRNKEGHCICVPIYSYGGQGCKKSGAKPEHHGIIYENSPGNQALQLTSEPELGFPRVRATTLSDMAPLNVASRVNYAKIVTVEHNAKVMFIGDVLADDFQIVDDAVKECFG